MQTLRNRVAALEAARRRAPRGLRGVFRALPGELPADALARARAAGFAGALIAPDLMPLADFMTWAQRDHAERERRNVELVGEVLSRAKPEHAAAFCRR